MSRPQRNRRLSRRVWSPEHDERHIRPVKRLFTPEIKRMLKDWLVRRRENPYPSREEKKRLAMETGLTYTQICNWFANWRRKLKNTENERIQNSWGMLIKNYNTNARGNVEQFSISSEDSIWEEEFDDEPCTEEDFGMLPRKRCLMSKKLQPLKRKKFNLDHYYVKKSNEIEQNESKYFLEGSNNIDLTAAQCLQVSSTTTTYENGQIKYESTKPTTTVSGSQENKTKYKQKMMEKYLRDQHVEEAVHNNETLTLTTETAEISKKWLDSATKFTPNKNNYYLEWVNRSKQAKHVRSTFASDTNNTESTYGNSVYAAIHHKDELDAAEALANLAFNCRQRMLDLKATAIQSAAPINAISS